jgi:putative zinc finger/helix-turn-helix YgiT family protein
MDTEQLADLTCSGCGHTGGVVRFSRREDVVIRGLTVGVTKVLRRCDACGEEFENSKDPDWRLAAYAQYRTAKGMVAPAAMRAWRERFGLKQSDVTALLGWGDVTLGRYENGSLATEAHDHALAGLMVPENLARALAARPETVPAERRAVAIRRLREGQSLLSPEDLRVIRVKYGLDEAAMATIIAVPETTWRAWESGDGTQTGPADAFLRVIAQRPDVVGDLLLSAGLLTGTSRDVLARLAADVDRMVSKETGMSVDDVHRVEEGYRRALPEAADRLGEAA